MAELVLFYALAGLALIVLLIGTCGLLGAWKFLDRMLLRRTTRKVV